VRPQATSALARQSLSQDSQPQTTECWQASSSASPSTTPRNGFCVLFAPLPAQSRPAAHRDLVTVVGHAAEISAANGCGERTWVTAGRRTAVSRPSSRPPPSPTRREGIEKDQGFLRMIQGAHRPIYAGKVVAAFGDSGVRGIEAGAERYERCGSPVRWPAISQAGTDQKWSCAKF